MKTTFQIMMILMLILLLNGCRTKQKTIEKEKFELKTKEISKKDSSHAAYDSVIAIKTHKKDIIEKEKSNIGKVTIEGKTDSLTPFVFHNVINGDTIQSILIQGNANFHVENNWKNKEKEQKKETKQQDLNIVAQVARNVVSKENIRDTAGEIKKINNEIKSTGFQAPVYLIIGICALVAIILFIIIKQFKK